MHNNAIEVGTRFLDKSILGQLVPDAHIVNWADRPFAFKRYRSKAAIALPEPRMGMRQVAHTAEEEIWSALLSTLGAPIKRKLGANWNDSCRNLIKHANQTLGRSAASGGGLYPTEIYLCVERSVFRPGVYHYDGAHHALTLLSAGKFTTSLSVALGQDKSHSAYLIIAANFWKSAFKYHNFAYNVCAQDVGAALATVYCAASRIGLEIAPYFQFHDLAVNQLAGLNTSEESAFVVLGVGRLGGDARQRREQASEIAAFEEIENPISLRSPLPHQRSKNVSVPSELSSIHWASLLERQLETQITRHNVLRPALMPSLISNLDPAKLSTRHSSWGSLRSFPRTKQSTLAELLHGIHSISNECDGADVPIFKNLGISILLYANHVEGLHRGIYQYSQHTHTLIAQGLPVASGARLQAFYRLKNYNLEQVACIGFVTANIQSALLQYGNRAIRMLNIQAGVLVQSAYLAAIPLGLECGAVLGLKAHEVNTWLGLENHKTVLVGLLLGRGVKEAEFINMPFAHGGPR